ncbi:unnamed protein product [Ixodes persulcatus]
MANCPFNINKCNYIRFTKKKKAALSIKISVERRCPSGGI